MKIGTWFNIRSFLNVQVGDWLMIITDVIVKVLELVMLFIS